MSARRRSLFLARVAILAGVVVLAQIVNALGLISPFLFPSPVEIARSIPSLISEEGVLGRLFITAMEVLCAAGAGIVIGGLTGWVLYRRSNGWLAFRSWIAGFNAAPHILLYPLFLVIVGRGSGVVVIMGILGALSPIIIRTREAFASVRPVLVDVGRSFNLSAAQSFWTIQLPAAVPMMAAGVRLGLFYAMVSVIGAEFLTGIGGLGALVPDLADRFQLAQMYGAILFIIFVSASFAAVLRRIERWLKPK